jgi:hypothetical protein
VVPFPGDFNPQPLIKKLRRHLFNRIRAAEIALEKFPVPQRQIVNWLHALSPSAGRNRLLQYFEVHSLTGAAFNELRNLWRERSQWSLEEWPHRLQEFAESHPYPAQEDETCALTPESEEALECHRLDDPCVRGCPDRVGKIRGGGLKI